MSVIQKRVYNESVYQARSREQLLDCGIVVINKPKGPFSFEITDSVKGILGVKKTGHGGTLDPNATGVLPIGINKGCHVLTALGKAGKAYKGVMHLHSSVQLNNVLETAKKFVGVITQLPPVRSAVKREEREREIYKLTVDDFNGREVKFTVECQAGTYIRKLATEWGEAMNTKAHLKDLVRIRAGPYTLEDSVTMEKFVNNPIKYVKPVETAVAHLRKAWLDDKTLSSMKNGAQPFLPGVYKYEEGIHAGDMIALMTPAQELAATAIAVMNSEEMKGNHGLFARTERSFL